MKSFFKSPAAGIAVIHFVFVLLGRAHVARLFTELYYDGFIAQPGLWFYEDVLGGHNRTLFWIVLILNSLLWGAFFAKVISAIKEYKLKKSKKSKKSKDSKKSK